MSKDCYFLDLLFLLSAEYIMIIKETNQLNTLINGTHIHNHAAYVPSSLLLHQDSAH